MSSGFTTDTLISAILMIFSVIISTISPFFAPAIGSFAIYIWVVSERSDLKFSFYKAGINSIVGGVLGKAIVYFLNIYFGLNSEGVFYLGLIVGSMTPILLSIISDREYITTKAKAVIDMFVSKFTGGKK